MKPSSAKRAPFAPFAELNELLDRIRVSARVAVVYSANPNDDGVVLFRSMQPRSWKSYREVAEQIGATLRAQGVAKVDVVAEGPAFQSNLAAKRYDLVWLNCAGIQGRDSLAHTAAACEALGVSYVGHSPLQAALMDDKVLMKQWLRGIGLPTAPFLVRCGAFSKTLAATDPDYAQAFGHGYRGPFLVKPAQGRGSVMVELVDSLSDVTAAAERINRVTQDRVIIEQFVAGQEYCTWMSGGLSVEAGSVVGERKLQIFGSSERLFLDHSRVYKKIEGGDAAVNDLARPLSPGEERLREDLFYLGRTVFSGLSLSVPVRMDVRRDEHGFFQILEVNPKPDLRRPDPGHAGLLAVALADLGCSYDDFIWKILADWVQFQLRCHPGQLSGLLSGLDRASDLAQFAQPTVAPQ